MIPLIFTVVLALLVAAITCYNGWKQPDEERYKRNNRIAVAFLFMAILTQVLTFYNGYTAISDKVKSDSLAVEKERDNRIANDSIKALNRQLHQLALENLDTSRTILRYSQELNKAYKYNIKLQGELYNQVTGNGVKPHLDPNTYGDHNPDEVGFSLDNFGKYPIYDISTLIMDGNILKALPNTPVEKRLELKNMATTKIEVGTLGGNMSTIDFFHIKLPKEVKSISYNVYISWRYGGFSQHVTFERNENGSFISKSK